MNICSSCSGDFAFAKCLSMDYKYSFTDDTTSVHVPQKLQCSREYNKLTKVSCTFQLFNHATKITNFWPQQHNDLFLACRPGAQVHWNGYVDRINGQETRVRLMLTVHTSTFGFYNKLCTLKFTKWVWLFITTVGRQLSMDSSWHSSKHLTNTN